jgi:hypothetical protein
MKRHGQRDFAKERFWRRILRLWHRSGPTSVRDFCAANGVSEPSFYAWRRLIAERDRQRQHAAHQRLLFVPLTVPAPVAASTPAVLELVVGAGRVVRVPSGFDAAALRQLLAVLEETPTC